MLQGHTTQPLGVGQFKLPEEKQRQEVVGFRELVLVISMARSAVTDVITNPATGSIAETIDLDRQSFLALTIPLKRQDPRLGQLAPSIKEWLARDYPTITPLLASGNSVADRRYRSAYWVQASLFFPLPDIPRLIQELLDSRPLTRRAAAESTTGNGRRPTRARELSLSRPVAGC